MICVMCQSKEAKEENKVLRVELENVFGMRIEVDDEVVCLCEECWETYEKAFESNVME